MPEPTKSNRASHAKIDPFDRLLIARFPKWAIPVVQVLCIVLCFILSFVFFQIGVQGIAKGITPIWVWAALGCYIASYLLGYSIYKARIAAALMSIFGKGIFRLLFRLLFNLIRKPNDEPDPELVKQVEESMPGEEDIDPFFRAFHKAARAFWQVALLFGLLAATLVMLGGGGVIGAFTTATACLAYGICLTYLARQGFLLVGDGDDF